VEVYKSYAYHIWRLWYIGSYTITANPIKTLELHYPTIQFLITFVIQARNDSVVCYIVNKPLPEAGISGDNAQAESLSEK